MKPLVRRVQAAQATTDAFVVRTFALGRNDCATMVRFHLRQMGEPLDAKVGKYRTLAEAKRELKRHGAKSLGEILDQQFQRIPPASALVGDIVELPAMRGLTGLGIVLGNGRILAYHEDIPAAGVLQPDPFAILGAWRVIP